MTAICEDVGTVTRRYPPADPSAFMNLEKQMDDDYDDEDDDDNDDDNNDDDDDDNNDDDNDNYDDDNDNYDDDHDLVPLAVQSHPADERPITCAC